MSTRPSQLLESLNPQQKAAASHIHGPMLVLAGAGAGKTKTLTHRIAYLIEQGIAPWHILAVTFTNKAAGEMRERALSMLEDCPAKPTISTFHSLGVRILRADIEALGRDKNFTITDADDALALVKQILKDLSIDPKQFTPRAIMSHISLAQNAFLSPQEYAASVNNDFTKVVSNVFARYHDHKIKNNLVDFDDLIVLPVKLFVQSPQTLRKYQAKWQYVAVDEFQDTNRVQLKFIELLCREHGNIAVIGDSDQSIYKFRGADVSNILDFQRMWQNVKLVKLEHNYRSTQHILDAADGVITNNTQRLPKTMHATKAGGQQVEVWAAYDEREESQLIAETITQLKEISAIKTPSQEGGASTSLRGTEGGAKPEPYHWNDFAVLVRTNAQTRAIEEALLRQAIPYQIIGGLKFYSRKEVKDVLAYLKYIVNPLDDVSLQRIINLPPRKIGKTTVARLANHAQQRGVSIGQVIDHVEMLEGVSPAAKNAIQGFQQKIRSLRHIWNTLTPAELIDKTIEMFALEPFYADGTEEGAMRFDNVMELKSVASKMDGIDTKEALPIFLEEVTLIADADNIATTDTVKLMTLHTAKGLEFPIVFLPGLEEGILPHSRSQSNPDDLEEERRLMYVGMTRAMEKLIILHAKNRLSFGDYQHNPRSRFVEEIPRHCVSQDLSDTNDTEDGYSYVTHEEVDFGLQVGDSVHHKAFGVGEIVELKGDVATISFADVGRKRLALTVAPLTKVGGVN